MSYGDNRNGRESLRAPSLSVVDAVRIGYAVVCVFRDYVIILYIQNLLSISAPSVAPFEPTVGAVVFAFC